MNTSIRSASSRLKSLFMQILQVSFDHSSTTHTEICSRSGIALWSSRRGDNEPAHGCGKPGNFLASMKILVNHDCVLKQHEDRPKLQNVTYLSSHTKNEMIDVTGKNTILVQIADEIKDAQKYTIMANRSHKLNLHQFAYVLSTKTATLEIN